jgi:hypothetical protein
LPLALRSRWRSRWHSLALGDNAAVKKDRSNKIYFQYHQTSIAILFQFPDLRDYDLDGVILVDRKMRSTKGSADLDTLTTLTLLVE